MLSAVSASAQVLDCAGKHQVLIFVHSRKETAKTARYLKDTALAQDHLARFMREESASREILQVRIAFALKIPIVLAGKHKQ